MKRILVAALAVAVGLILNSCGNMDIFGPAFRYDRAIIQTPDGKIIEGQVEIWLGFSSDQIQVTIEGKTYLVDAENICLIAGSED